MSVCTCVYKLPLHILSVPFLQSCKVLGNISHSTAQSFCPCHHGSCSEEDGAMASLNDLKENDEYEPDTLSDCKGQLTWGLGPAGHLQCPSAIDSKAQSTGHWAQAAQSPQKDSSK